MTLLSLLVYTGSIIKLFSINRAQNGVYYYVSWTANAIAICIYDIGKTSNQWEWNKNLSG